MTVLQSNYPSSQYVNSKLLILLCEVYLSSSHVLFQDKSYLVGSPFSTLNKKRPCTFNKRNLVERFLCRLVP